MATGCNYQKTPAMVSGRFKGRQGALQQIQTFENGEQLEDFTGGNLIAISPGGKSVYA